MLLERLAHHLGGQANLHILQTLNLFVLVADQLIARALGLRKLELVCRLGLLLTRITHRQLTRELRARLIALALRRGDRLRELHFGSQFLLAQLGTQALGFTLGLHLSVRELLTHFCLVIGKPAIRFVVSSVKFTLRLGRSSCECHFLSLICRSNLGLQFCNLSIAHGEVMLGCITNRRLGDFSFVSLVIELRLQSVDLALELRILLLGIGTSLNSRTLACALAFCGSALELGTQLGKLSAALRFYLLQGGRRTRALKLQRLLALALDGLHALIQIARELGITHLFDDVRIAGCIDLKDFAAMWALDLVHSSSSMDAHFNCLHSTAACGQKRRRRQNGNGARTTTKGTGTFVVVWVLTDRGSR